ncbi:MAG TPA: glycosyltransferase, partial [Burkholderiaceae bacterium]
MGGAERVTLPIDDSWNASAAGRVVHVAGALTDEVFSFLGPAIDALARSGVDQSVVIIDEPRWRHRVASLHASAELVPAPSLRNPARQWQAVLQACRQALQGRPLRAVHLHGLLPYLIGNYAVRSTHCEAPTIYSPHGSRSLGNARGIRALARFAVGLTLQPSRRAAIVNLPQEPGEFKAWSRAELVESPVAELFLGLRRE